MQRRHDRDTRERARLLRRGGLLGLLLAVVAVAVLVATTALVDTGDPATAPATPEPSATVPTSPSSRVCGNEKLLDGPREAPAGAVEVRPGDRLDELTRAEPPNTTFWLAPGVHRLGTGKFDQVVPKEGSTYVGAPGAVLDGQRRNRYAFTGDASSVTIRHLTVQNFGVRGANNDEGVVNHDSASGWTIERSTVRRNAGAGVMLGSGNQVRGTCLSRNGQYGFNAYHPSGVTELTLAGNEIVGNNADDWERRRPGCGCSGGGKFWEVDGADIRRNWVHDNRGAGLWADTNNLGFAIEGNYIADNDAEGLFYETSYNALVRNNTFARNGHVKGRKNQGFPTGAIYLSEAGSDARVPGRYSKHLEITGNVFTDNWSGVILWENADRFAGSPANTSTGASTLVNPSVATVDSCNRANIAKKPYYDDCRWKTQNVRVHRNEFKLDPAAIDEKCLPSNGCGYNGIFANWGTYPAWSPYKESVIQDEIVFDQDNRFDRNTYVGPWRFVVHDQGTKVSWATWQSGPYGQDIDSVIQPDPTCSGKGARGKPRCRTATDRTGD